jgi:hypothetical protein
VREFESEISSVRVRGEIRGQGSEDQGIKGEIPGQGQRSRSEVEVDVEFAVRQVLSRESRSEVRYRGVDRGQRSNVMSQRVRGVSSGI